MNELNRLEIIQRSLRGDLTVAVASGLLALTERQIYRHNKNAPLPTDKFDRIYRITF